MQFNPHPNKQANEDIFFWKNKKQLSSLVAFNNNVIKKYPHHKHLGIVLDSKLDFQFHVNQKIKKCNKLIGLIRRLSVNVPRNALLTICKLLIRPHLEYGDMINQKMKIFKIN